MKIDAHQHFWRYTAEEYAWIDDSMAALRRDFLPAELRGEMAAAGIDACVAIQARQTAEETSWLLALADAHPFIAGVIGWIDLRADDVERQLQAAARHPKLVGVRHIVQSEPDDDFMLRPDFCRGVSLLADFGLAYDILIYPRHLTAAAALAGRFPRQRFVLDHLAKPDIRAREMRAWEHGINQLAALPNVCAKVSGLVTEADWTTWTAADIHPYMDAAFSAFGAGRLIAGPDWPVCTVAAGYGRTMSVVSDYLAGRPERERDAVMGGNAARLWRLDVAKGDPA